MENCRIAAELELKCDLESPLNLGVELEQTNQLSWMILAWKLQAKMDIRKVVLMTSYVKTPAFTCHVKEVGPPSNLLMAETFIGLENDKAATLFQGQQPELYRDVGQTKWSLNELRISSCR